MLAYREVLQIQDGIFGRLGEQRLLLAVFYFNGPCAVKIKSKHYNFTCWKKVTNTLGIFRNSCKSGFTSDEIGVNYQ